MAAQGQSFFQASGDSDAYTGSQTLDNSSQATAPVDSTNITCVGGTTLTMNGAGVSWSSETVWNWNNSGQPNVGSGGGISTYYTIPFWQTNVSMAANSGSTVWRNIPDVALTADNVYVAYNNGSYRRLRRHELRRAVVGRLLRARQPAVRRRRAERPSAF